MKLLTANIHFHTAQMNRTPIAVYAGKERIGYGVIDEITDNSVKIGDERYLREVCTFKLLGGSEH